MLKSKLAHSEIKILNLNMFQSRWEFHLAIKKDKKYSDEQRTPNIR